MVELKKCASRRGGNDARVSSQITSQNAQLRAPLSPLQTAWTSFDPYFYSGGSSSAGPTLVKLTASLRSLCQGHCVSHNAPVEYTRPCSCYFPPEQVLLRMTHCYINKGQNRSRLFVRDRVELLIRHS